MSPGALADAFVYATDYLAVFIDEVNALNVYPVPDGDTGTNMHLTLQSVRRQLIDDAPEGMADVAHALAYGSLLGARGNSGVILSQVLKGFAEGVKGHAELVAATVAQALRGATKTAYAAVMKPVEGTILTVVREAAEAVAEPLPDEVPVALLQRALVAGHAALERTPEQLPILKQAGVVDAGGLGFLRMLEGVIAAFEGAALPAPPKVTQRAQQQFEEEAFGFCTEFLLSGVAVDTREIQDAVASFGDSLLVVGAEGFVKGHIHTEEPEKLLALVAKYGNMVRSKVEDMSEQHSEILADVDMGAAEPPKTGLVAVSNGYGLTKAFRSLGARVVGGGQTNNPSVQDIADAVRSLGASDVIVMPNNKNIIMAARRVDELVADKRVLVLPTRTIGQGLAAAVLFSEDQEADALMPGMERAVEGARTLEVTTASRDATIDGVDVHEGAFIGLLDTVLTHTADTAEDCLLAMLAGVADEVDIGSLFYAPAVGEEAAQALAERIAEAHPALELEVHGGGPDLYPYLLVLE
ncbi:MAG: DAK2 domain-containing protein [Trueperaceae bacterium]|nr:DAK2 domain-containing protein [Trueperaceae bacterium]